MLINLDFLNAGSGWPPYSERARLKRYKDNKALFEGEHLKVFKEIWMRLFRTEWQMSVEIMLNWPKRISTIWADLLLGETPIVSDGKSETNTAYINDLITKLKLWKAAYMAAIDTSRYGDGVFKVRRTETDGIKVAIIPPEFWFPVVNPLDAKDVLYHVIAWPSRNNPNSLNDWSGKLHVEIHGRETIEYRVYDLPMPGCGLKAPMEITQESNTIGHSLVVHCPGLETSDTIYGRDDYDDLTSILQELEVRIAQTAKILDMHAEPKMYGPSDVIQKDPDTGKPRAMVGDYFPVDADTTPPGYIVWNAQLEYSFKQIETLKEQLYMLSETSPALFGKIETGLAESGSAMKRLFMAPLAKVNRVRMNFDPAIKEVISIAAALDGKKYGDIVPVITWKDGLPDDETEDISNATKATGGELLSKHTARMHLYGMTDKESDQEDNLIKTEQGSVDVPAVQIDDGDTADNDGE